MSSPLGQSVDCDVCIAKAGQPCYIQTSADEHRRTGHVYQSGNTFIGKERYHVGIRLKPTTRNKTNDGGTTVTMPVGELPDLRNLIPNKDKESK